MEDPGTMTGTSQEPDAFEQGLERYIPHTDLEKIRNVRIGIAGAGGLGSNCAALLVRCGFRKFTLVDNDSVDRSNLNRQFFFFRQIGKPKVNMLRENLLAIRPGLDIRTVNTRLTPDTLEQWLGDCHVIVEAFDLPECKKMIVEAYLNSGKLLVGASGIGGYGVTHAMGIRKIRETVYIVGDGTSEACPDCPPLAPGIAAAAAMQADIILTCITGRSIQ